MVAAEDGLTEPLFPSGEGDEIATVSALSGSNCAFAIEHSN